MLVETLYNKLAINTGFPLYIDATAAPDTTRFLLEMLNRALRDTIDNIYLSSNIIEKRDTITTVAGEDHYAIDGMVKSVQYTQDNTPVQLSGRIIPFNIYNDDPGVILRKNKYGAPVTYVIDRGDIRFFPTPDKAYRIQVISSTTDLVWANDDSSRDSIESIEDSIAASKEFCEIVLLRACAFTLGRCNNRTAEFYSKLASDRLRVFMERDSNSLEKPHLYNPIKGHYNPRRGLLG